ncbi:MAG: 1-(5-phosphoribosyl)-5-[(5-phosphoribosylamino)methylideneamino]imidazole-4-carboxamide isomerase [Clostridiales Family XIII bacterium]|jgi:phosphoribosylformimino-5-aminoimidazole carboxamide ribotide isomerase|nr:1-(5-phosphoribosyl)-5-[(5-phosphoribosylamino)methylideneamino]imidazole-4-carboxamide isomerase [Clostridiales Family XIII bacterium]
MIILPAIDLKGGKPVRLTKGDFATTEQVADAALSAALSFEQLGATHLHMVDLDGALAGAPVNDAVVREVVRGTRLFVEIGGGIRTRETVDYYLNHIGARRVILGSVAIKDPDFAKEMVAAYGEAIAIGIDAKEGKASGGGWLDDSDVDFIELARAMAGAGARTIIYTDISKDGTLAGPDLAGLAALNAAVPADVIASGGIATIDDVRTLKALGVSGAICGKSIYKGTLSLEDALKYQ